MMEQEKTEQEDIETEKHTQERIKKRRRHIQIHAMIKKLIKNQLQIPEILYSF